MKISLASVMVSDQALARRFYTEVLGFRIRQDLPMGAYHWLTVVSPEAPGGTELVLEPAGTDAARTFQAALYAAGTPWTAFECADLLADYARLVAAGVVFKGEPTPMGSVVMAFLDDTVGDWIGLYQPVTV